MVFNEGEVEWVGVQCWGGRGEDICVEGDCVRGESSKYMGAWFGVG